MERLINPVVITNMVIETAKTFGCCDSEITLLTYQTNQEGVFFEINMQPDTYIRTICRDLLLEFATNTGKHFKLVSKDGVTFCCVRWEYGIIVLGALNVEKKILSKSLVSAVINLKCAA